MPAGVNYPERSEEHARPGTVDSPGPPGTSPVQRAGRQEPRKPAVQPCLAAVTRAVDGEPLTRVDTGCRLLDTGQVDPDRVDCHFAEHNNLEIDIVSGTAPLDSGFFNRLSGPPLTGGQFPKSWSGGIEPLLAVSIRPNSLIII